MNDDATTWAAQAWSRHQRDLRRFIGRLANNPVDVDDIVAHTYEVLVRARANAEGVADERLFVLGVGANVARHHARTQQRGHRVAEAFAAESLTSSNMTSPEAQLERRQIEQDLAWAIEQLNPDQRALILKLNDGATAAEVSRLLGEPEATVRSRAFHARKRLKRLLEQRWLIVAALALLAAAGFAAYRVFIVPKLQPRPVMPRLKTEVPVVDPPALVDTFTADKPTLPVRQASVPSAVVPKASPGPSAPTPPLPKVSKRDSRVEPAPTVGTSATAEPSTPAASSTQLVPATALELFEAANRMHFTEKKYGEAVNGWNQFLEAYPDAELADDARYNRVVALFKLGRLTEAEASATEALAQSSRTPHRAELEKLLVLIASAKK